MADVSATLVAARKATGTGDWPQAYALFTAAREQAPLSADDAAALADAAWWIGRIDDCIAASDAAFQGYLATDRPRDAVMMAMGVAVSFLLRGDEARGSGWLARAERLLDDLPEGPEHGYARYTMEVEGGLHGEDLQAVVAAARDVQQLGRKHGDRTLVALGGVGEGRALVKLGEVARGMRLLDEAMLAVADEQLAPEWAGDVYCNLMAACHELADIGRARQWTDATSKWLSTLHAAVLFTGICRVHRSQVHHTAGDWDRAEQEARRVIDDLTGLHVESVAAAHYQLGEVHRLRGELEAAEDAYARARELGRDPQPGLALLCLTRGRHDAAAAGIQAALHAAGSDRLARAPLCGAQVEVGIAAGALDVARRACEELEATAAVYGTSGLEAAALHWRGALAAAEGRHVEALPALRAAYRRWRDVDARYDAARTAVLLAQAYAALGDRDAFSRELDIARETFAHLGAEDDARLVALLTGDLLRPGGLTEREAEVLQLVAGGSTNRQVAEILVLSEKTVARHLSNIFGKLGVSTRTEAAAFAFEHGLATSAAPHRG